jgi:hypothetical protein
MNRGKIATALCALLLVTTGCAGTGQNSVVADSCAELLPLYENWDGQNPDPSVVIAKAYGLMSDLVDAGFTYEDEIGKAVADIWSYHSDALALGFVRGYRDDYFDQLKQACS